MTASVHSSRLGGAGQMAPDRLNIFAHRLVRGGQNAVAAGFVQFCQQTLNPYPGCGCRSFAGRKGKRMIRAQLLRRSFCDGCKEPRFGVDPVHGGLLSMGRWVGERRQR